LLRGEHAPVRVVLPKEPPDPAYPPSFGVASYLIGYRAAWAKAFAEVDRQQGGQAPCWAPTDAPEALEPPTDAPAAPPLTGASDAMDPRLWDVSGPSGQVLAIQQPSALSGRLMTVLAAAGVSCSRVVSPYQPTLPPVITPTKVGGFTVQVTVNPVGSGG
jgi:hypothetical protein